MTPGREESSRPACTDTGGCCGIMFGRDDRTPRTGAATSLPVRGEAAPDWLRRGEGTFGPWDERGHETMAVHAIALGRLQ